MMPKVRVEIASQPGIDFDPREWLRREVLWGSLIAPYQQQWDTWHNGSAKPQHAGNISRAELFAAQGPDVSMQSLAFFNRGKNVGGILSSAALFRTARIERPRQDHEPITDFVLRTQARCIDMALGLDKTRSLKGFNDHAGYTECERLALSVPDPSDKSYATSHRLLRAAKIMSGLSVVEAAQWCQLAQQNADESLPILTINNGGHPRSGGPRIDTMQPIFEGIVASNAFQALAH